MKNKVADNIFHKGNKIDGKHYWLTPQNVKDIVCAIAKTALDTRIPLSEWIPPIGVPVLYIDGNSFAYTVFTEINEKGLFCIWSTQLGRVIANLDGHWMRIV